MSKKKRKTPTQVEEATTTSQTVSLDVRLVANIGDEVYYLCPQIDYVQIENNEEMQITVSEEGIVKGTVCNVHYDVSENKATKVFMRIEREDGYTEDAQRIEFLRSTKLEFVQEFFFSTLEEAKKAVAKLSTHPNWNVNTWLEDCKEFMARVYPYQVCLPYEVGQIHESWKVKGLYYGCFTTLISSAIVNLNTEVRYTQIIYMGKATSGKASKPKFKEEYKIVKKN